MKTVKEKSDLATQELSGAVAATEVANTVVQPMGYVYFQNFGDQTGQLVTDEKQLEMLMKRSDLQRRMAEIKNEVRRGDKANRKKISKLKGGLPSLYLLGVPTKPELGRKEEDFVSSGLLMFDLDQRDMPKGGDDAAKATAEKIEQSLRDNGWNPDDCVALLLESPTSTELKRKFRLYVRVPEELTTGSMEGDVAMIERILPYKKDPGCHNKPERNSFLTSWDSVHRVRPHLLFPPRPGFYEHKAEASVSTSVTTSETAFSVKTMDDGLKLLERIDDWAEFIAYYLKLELRDEPDVLVKEGGRHHKLVELAHRMRLLGLSADEAATLLLPHTSQDEADVRKVMHDIIDSDREPQPTESQLSWMQSIIDGYLQTDHSAVALNEKLDTLRAEAEERKKTGNEAAESAEDEEDADSNEPIAYQQAWQMMTKAQTRAELIAYGFRLPHHDELPPLLQKLASYCNKENLHTAIFFSVTTALTIFIRRGVKMLAPTGKPTQPVLQTVITAPTGEGKSTASDYVEQLLANREKLEMEARNRISQAKEARLNAKANEKKTSVPKEDIRLIEVNATPSSLLQNQINQQLLGHTVLFRSEELDAVHNLCSGLRQGKAFLRKGYDCSRHGAERSSDNGVSGTAYLCISTLILSTLDQLRNFYSDSDAENGSSNRLLLTYFERKYGTGPLRYGGIFTDDFQEAMKPYIERLEKAEPADYEVPGLLNWREKVDECFENYVVSTNDRALGTIFPRAVETAARIGFILWLAHDKKWSESIEKFCHYSLCHTLLMQLAIFSKQIQSANESRLTIGAFLKPMEIAVEKTRKQQVGGRPNLLPKLPDTFTLKDLYRLREDPKSGIADPHNEDQARKQIKNWLNKKQVEISKRENGKPVEWTKVTPETASVQKAETIEAEQHTDAAPSPEASAPTAEA